MTVALELKNSTVEDKYPTSGQLQNGEISLNYAEAGSFLCCKDSDGNIQQVGGIKLSETAPANPVKQTLWLKPSTKIISVYDGANWLNTGGVFSVNGQTGAVVITPASIGALKPGDNVSDLTNDAGYITSAAISVQSVNGKTGTVVLTAADVGAATTAQGALANTALQAGDNVSDLSNDAAYITTAGAPVQSVNTKVGSVVLNAGDVGAATAAQGALANSALQPGDNVSELVNNAGYIVAGGAPVQSVNGQTGIVVLDAADVGALDLTGGTLTGDLDIDGKIEFKASDGSADFNGDVSVGGGTIELDATGSASFAGGNIELNADGSASMAAGEYLLNVDGYATFGVGDITTQASVNGSGFRRNYGRDSRIYGTYSAAIQCEGGSNASGRVGLTRTGYGGPPGIHFGKTNSYTNVDPPIADNVLAYPVIDNSNQSLGNVCSYFADGYQYVLAARIQSSLIGTPVPGAGVGLSGTCRSKMTVTVQDITGQNSTIVDLSTSTIELPQPNTVINFSDSSSVLAFEEGSWSPNILCSGNTLTAGISDGYYVRVGSMIFVSARVGNVTMGANTGDCTIIGLPFLVSTDKAGPVFDQGGGMVSTTNNLGSIVSYGAPSIQTKAGSNQLIIRYYENTTLGSQKKANETWFANGNEQVRFYCSYWTDD